MKIYTRWAEREYSPQQRSSALLIEAIFFVIFLPALLYLLSSKVIEEKELEARFGEANRAYKLRVPFMLPRFR